MAIDSRIMSDSRRWCSTSTSAQGLTVVGIHRPVQRCHVYILYARADMRYSIPREEAHHVVVVRPIRHRTLRTHKAPAGGADGGDEDSEKKNRFCTLCGKGVGMTRGTRRLPARRPAAAEIAMTSPSFWEPKGSRKVVFNPKVIRLPIPRVRARASCRCFSCTPAARRTGIRHTRTLASGSWCPTLQEACPRRESTSPE